MKSQFKLKDSPVPRRKLEALVEAMIQYSGYREPSSGVYQARNPANLRAYRQDHVRDEEGRRVFPSVIDGLQAALWDMAYKLSGQSTAHLQPSQSLVELVGAYHLPSGTSQAWARFLRQALHNETITAKTPLSFFQEP